MIHSIRVKSLVRRVKLWDPAKVFVACCDEYFGRERWDQSPDDFWRGAKIPRLSCVPESAARTGEAKRFGFKAFSTTLGEHPVRTHTMQLR
jgi:hypothetical protein